MRSSRALFGAFSGGVVLAIAASCALLAVSSVVAFRGWPQSDAAPRDPEVSQLQKVQAAQAKSAKVVAVAALPKVAAPAPAAHRAKAKARAKAKGRHARQSARRSSSTNGTTAGTATKANGQQPPAQQDQGGQGHAPGPSSKANPVKQATDAVRDTTKAAADAVAPVAPDAGPALASLGNAGAGAVDQVTDTAGKVVNGALGGG